MKRFGQIIHGSATLLFVGSSFAYAVQSRPAPLLAAFQGSDGAVVLPGVPAASDAAQTLALPQLYMSPENPLMWALLIVLWLSLALDAITQLRESSEDYSFAAAAGPNVVWPALSLALLAGAAWPWMVDRQNEPVLLGALFMVLATVIAARRARRSNRPAIGFLAGWSTATGIAALAAILAERLGLTIAQAAVLAILPGVLIGLAAQGRIGPSITYPTALIWAFVALATTTMGSSPMIAMAAIVGVSAMAMVLIEAAS
ncbi:MAG: hypothetical protein ACU0BZ_05150 [Paracoccus sp. (in: a-proteobacteria)]|uniref:hypothetical protein n=1 Tax=unclassified Paracoccus (in: a-proteobacteria) TaxID=2688777 RepID=UPI000C51D83D|nr:MULTISPECIES: hypothetical protein [unclassified Paracoccus (in: a-proteobacteria)]MAN56596.1 hypothetical protein [Paracoccus sp. (in: a-proteobacteria)]MBA49320.1 hypothetical protein [Paracoccus sp. (in: a-proteobacteria)]MCS5600935.1 hypothetical protein [Paracoccus sp. (in: a-proteobacteria)]|tara:strand:+ start:18882 stop:19655 length:774 start_codon:yes stop_codon:yes gene_type:complete